MRQNNFSQLPVKSKEEGVSAGRITEGRIMEVGQPDMKVREAMSSKFLEVVPTTSIDIVKEILKEDPALMVQEEKSSDYVGIITKTDLL